MHGQSGYYEGDKLIYPARTRSRESSSSNDFAVCILTTAPFANLPEPRGGCWGAGFTAEKMSEYRSLKPILVTQFEFVEWTPDNHLRHSKFIAPRTDKKAKDVRRE